MRLDSPREVTLLHVDDEPGFAEVVAEFLERESDALDVHTATTVEDAAGVIDSEPVDCVVSDYDMPEQTGLEFLERLRDDHPDLPFILVTGKGSEEIASRAISAGVTDYLQKGRSTDQYTILANRVLNAVQTARAEDAVERTEERYHNLVDTAPLPIVLFDDDQSLVYANDAAVEFLEADSADDFGDLTMPELVHPDDRDAARERFASLMNGERAVPGRTFRIRALDGSTKRAPVATASGHYRGERVAQAILYDSPQADSEE
jgi:PAS domain S-box-containing protein